MYIKIHRGTRQIGGNLVEIGAGDTRLLFDVGANLPPLDCEDLFQATIRGTEWERNGESWRQEVVWQRFVVSRISKTATPRQWLYFQKFYQKRTLMGAESLARAPGKKVIFVRASMIPFLKKYLNTRQETGNLLIYSMWNGYRERGRTKKFLDFCREWDMAIADCHVSGHASRETVEALVRELSPATLVPIHCEAEYRGDFFRLHNNCLMLEDRQCLEIE